MMTDILKGVGATEVLRDSLKMDARKLVSAGPQNAASNPIRSGCFPDVHSP